MLLRSLFVASTSSYSALRSAKTVLRPTTSLNVSAASRPATMSTVSDAISTLGLPSKFGHFIGGKFVEPIEGQYFDNITPINGENFIQAARGTEADINKAVEAAHEAFDSTWSKVSVTERSNILLKIADAIEANAERLTKVEAIDNGKAVRETISTDIPLCIDHFRYFAGVIRAEEGTASEIDSNTLSLCIQEPIGVVGQIIPWNFPLLVSSCSVFILLVPKNAWTETPHLTYVSCASTG